MQITHTGGVPMKKKIFVLTLILTIFASVIPVSAKTSKAELEETQSAETRMRQHGYWAGFFKESTSKKFDAADPATYDFTALVLVNAYNNSGKSMSDFTYVTTGDAEAIVRGLYFSIASEKKNKKKAGDILEIFSDGMWENFDGTEYVSKKWLFATIEAFKNGYPTYDKASATKKVTKVKDNWKPLYDSPGRGVLTKLEVVNIVYDYFVREFIK